MAICGSETGRQRLGGNALQASDAFHKNGVDHALAEVEDLVGTGELDEFPTHVEQIVVCRERHAIEVQPNEERPPRWRRPPLLSPART